MEQLREVSKVKSLFHSGDIVRVLLLPDVAPLIACSCCGNRSGIRCCEQTRIRSKTLNKYPYNLSCVTVGATANGRSFTSQTLGIIGLGLWRSCSALSLDH